MTEERRTDGPPPKKNSEYKPVTMPSVEQMIKKLRRAKLLGPDTVKERFYEHFVKSIALQPIFGTGLVWAWEESAYEILEGYPSAMKETLDLDFAKAIDTITPDPKVAQQAKIFRQQALKEAEKNT